MWQTLKALKFMHSANLLHRDMKPSNLLLNSDCLMKVADFGLARSMPKGSEDNPNAEGDDYEIVDGKAAILTDYIATRWYRAPEILVGSNKYSTAVDMWGAGCIFGEILAGKPVFAGSSTMQQLELVCGLLGVPDEEVCRHISPWAIKMIDSMQVAAAYDGKEWERRFPAASGFALDLLKQLLIFDPRKRVSAAEALKHDYLKQFHDEWVERNATTQVQICIPDNHRKSTAQYRERLYKEAGEFRKKEKEDDLNLKHQDRGKSMQGGRSRPQQRSQAPQPAQAAGQLRPDGPTAARRPADQPRDTLREMARAMGLGGGDD
jgi:mitogen-activated protein kinase 15